MDNDFWKPIIGKVVSVSGIFESSINNYYVFDGFDTTGQFIRLVRNFLTDDHERAKFIIIQPFNSATIKVVGKEKDFRKPYNKYTFRDLSRFFFSVETTRRLVDSVYWNKLDAVSDLLRALINRDDLQPIVHPYYSYHRSWVTDMAELLLDGKCITLNKKKRGFFQLFDFSKPEQVTYNTNDILCYIETTVLD